MPRLYIDHGDDREVHAEQFLGDESPVEFVDGYAEVESEDGASHLVRSDPHISFAEPSDTGRTEAESDDDSGPCPEVITSGDREGEICGRDLPCRFHD